MFVAVYALSISPLAVKRSCSYMTLIASYRFTSIGFAPSKAQGGVARPVSFLVEGRHSSTHDQPSSGVSSWSRQATQERFWIAFTATEWLIVSADVIVS